MKNSWSQDSSVPDNDFGGGNGDHGVLNQYSSPYYRLSSGVPWAINPASATPGQQAFMGAAMIHLNSLMMNQRSTANSLGIAAGQQNSNWPIGQGQQHGAGLLGMSGHSYVENEEEADTTAGAERLQTNDVSVGMDKVHQAFCHGHALGVTVNSYRVLSQRLPEYLDL
jgi:hypothetical protein